MGVTSFVRNIFLKPRIYKRLIELFNGTSVDLDVLHSAWTQIVCNKLSPLTTEIGHIVFVVDGTDVAESVRKMPDVHLLHNRSDTKILKQDPTDFILPTSQKLQDRSR